MTNIESLVDEMRNFSSCQSEKGFDEISIKISDSDILFSITDEMRKDFFIVLLSDDEICQKKGLYQVAMILTEVVHLIDEKFYDQIAECFIKNYYKYNDYLLCLYMSDFFAYYYHNYKKTVNIFSKIKEKEEYNDIKGIADSGFRLIEQEKIRRQFE